MFFALIVCSLSPFVCLVGTRVPLVMGMVYPWIYFVRLCVCDPGPNRRSRVETESKLESWWKVAPQERGWKLFVWFTCPWTVLVDGLTLTHFRIVIVPQNECDSWPLFDLNVQPISAYRATTTTQNTKEIVEKNTCQQLRRVDQRSNQLVIVVQLGNHAQLSIAIALVRNPVFWPFLGNINAAHETLGWCVRMALQNGRSEDECRNAFQCETSYSRRFGFSMVCSVFVPFCSFVKLVLYMVVTMACIAMACIATLSQRHQSTGSSAVAAMQCVAAMRCQQWSGSNTVAAMQW